VDRLPFKEESENLVKLIKRHRKAGAIFATAAVCLSTLFTSSASAATLTSASLNPSVPTAGAVATHALAFSSASAGIQCTRVHYGATSAFGGLPTGLAFDQSGSPSVLSTNAVAWTTTFSGDYVQGSGASATPTTISVTKVTNPTTSGAYWVKVELFSASNCTGLVDSGQFQFAVTDNTQVTVSVDPSFGFSVGNQSTACNSDPNYQTGAGSATAVALGTISGSTQRSGGQLLTVTGNAGGGYTVYVRSTANPAMTSPGHNWQNATGTYPTGAALDAAERFGFTFDDLNASGTVDDTEPANGFYMPLTTGNQAVMDATAGSATGTGCVSYVAQTDGTTPAGSYSATVIYTAVPVF
jgi:hypothetical protein